MSTNQSKLKMNKIMKYATYLGLMYYSAIAQDNIFKNDFPKTEHVEYDVKEENGYLILNNLSYKTYMITQFYNGKTVGVNDHNTIKMITPNKHGYVDTAEVYAMIDTNKDMILDSNEVNLCLEKILSGDKKW